MIVSERSNFGFFTVEHKCRLVEFTVILIISAEINHLFNDFTVENAARPVEINIRPLLERSASPLTQGFGQLFMLHWDCEVHGRDNVLDRSTKQILGTIEFL